MTISVILSTYSKERPKYLDAAIKSIWIDQIRKPDEIVLVEDGTLTLELDTIVNKWKKVIGAPFHVIYNKENKGLASALNDAVSIATGDLLARMDSDDISLPERFLLQERYMEEHPDVDILGGSLCEFNDEGTLNNVRAYPSSMEQIRKSIHRASPMGHPTVMFRRRFFDEGFRYSSKYHICEDVVLWFDAIIAGKVLNNMPQVLLKFRRNDSMLNRRSREKAWGEFLAYNNGIFRMNGAFSYKYIFSVLRLIFRLLPVSAIRYFYNSGLRHRITSK